MLFKIKSQFKKFANKLFTKNTTVNALDLNYHPNMTIRENNIIMRIEHNRQEKETF